MCTPTAVLLLCVCNTPANLSRLSVCHEVSYVTFYLIGPDNLNSRSESLHLCIASIHRGHVGYEVHLYFHNFILFSVIALSPPSKLIQPVCPIRNICLQFVYTAPTSACTDCAGQLDWCWSGLGASLIDTRDRGHGLSASPAASRARLARGEGASSTGCATRIATVISQADLRYREPLVKKRGTPGK